MRRLWALIAGVALLIPFTGIVQADNGSSGDTAAGPRAYGHFLIGDDRGPLGWVTVDVRPLDATTGPAAPGTFRFDALPGVTSIAATTRSVIAAVDFYKEEGCCGYPDVAVIFGYECHYSATSTDCRNFTAGLYDVASGRGQDFFRWGETGYDLGEYWVSTGTLTVNLGP